MKRVNCAIYTRKSSDEGLEKEFNSLDAQREACEAYILSQKHAGWAAVRDLYDDGGLSGGTLERPALQRLLADITAGRVQIWSSTRSIGSRGHSLTSPRSWMFWMHTMRRSCR